MYVETNVAAAALRRCSCRVLICGFLSVAARISFVRLELLKKLARASSARCSIVKTVVSICLEYGFLAQLGMLNLVGDCNTQMAPPNNPVRRTYFLLFTLIVTWILQYSHDYVALHTRQSRIHVNAWSSLMH